NRLIPSLEDRCVWVDILSGMENGVRYLVSQGHKKIAYLASDERHNPDALERMNGYKKALSDADIYFDENLVSYSFPSEVGGEYAVKKLLESKVEFSAIVCYNDAMAVGALNTLSEHNIKVPEDVSIVGYDDNQIVNFIKPKLTTVRYPIEEVGRRAAELALALLAEKEALEKEKNCSASDEFSSERDNDIKKFSLNELKFEPELIVRNSVTNISK
ncbi:MAG: substrate-binding domain-containing protein, partial [Succinivibrionaceae bacterium]